MLTHNSSNAIALAQLLLLLCLFFIPSMAIDPSSSEATVHIVYTERPEEGQEPEQYHIKTLASVCGSEDAARKAFLYSYSHAASGFAAKLTSDQVSQLSKQAGVLSVVPSLTFQLHSGPGKMQV
ncbi:hypothetical protein OROGR_025738 [Orobanche gracilis]